MANGYPQSRTRALLAEEEAVANRLLTQGLTVQQVRMQLRCSPAFVRRIKREMHGGEAAVVDQSQAKVRSLNHVMAMRSACDALAVQLRDDGPEGQTLHEAETTLIGLAHRLEEELQGYTTLRGGVLQETVVMRAGLTAAQGDLSWVELWRHAVPAAEVRARLSHALHGIANALSLLRWART